MKTSDLTGPALDWAVAKCNVRHHETVLTNHSYWVGERDLTVRPEHAGAFMVTDPDDIDGYAIVGDDIDALIIEAHDTLFDVVAYSTDWAQGGPLIEGMFAQGLRLHTNEFMPRKDGPLLIVASLSGDVHAGFYFGPTPLIAAMRCFVASNLGDEVEVPDELA